MVNKNMCLNSGRWFCYASKALFGAAHPKKFLKLNGQDTMLQATFERLSKLEIAIVNCVFIKNHRFFLRDYVMSLIS